MLRSSYVLILVLVCEENGVVGDLSSVWSVTECNCFENPSMRLVCVEVYGGLLSSFKVIVRECGPTVSESCVDREAQIRVKKTEGLRVLKWMNLQLAKGSFDFLSTAFDILEGHVH
ncbi:hypothetical protein DY000_02062355 [Brassica cretica]|uniref:Uncharacterized protein n=1 Tax=Brassica cretica TaxID=69181 RepID=A0ABQ7AW82_BRACR|nr:hypothetical protein DY000_02062355 [Brassica cretica]